MSEDIHKLHMEFCKIPMYDIKAREAFLEDLLNTKVVTVSKEHTTPTAELVERFESETNPVTKAVYRSIIATRLGIAERQEQVKEGRNRAARKYLDKCTFSFSGRKRMEDLFEQWFML